MASVGDILQKARDYVSWDPCKETADEIQLLIEQENVKALEDLIGQRQSFGTAGLRGPMCAGYAGLNYLVVLQTTQGLVRYLQRQLGSEVTAERGVVIGYDHRQKGSMNSKGFGELCARIFSVEGIKVYLYEDIIATPLVPYGVVKLNAAAGIMITASHNPKADNGYKLYWGNGVQITPPHDGGIYSSILENLTPWRDFGDVDIPHVAIGDFNESLREYIGKTYMADQKISILNNRHDFVHHSDRKLAYTGMSDEY